MSYPFVRYASITDDSKGENSMLKYRGMPSLNSVTDKCITLFDGAFFVTAFALVAVTGGCFDLPEDFFTVDVPH